MTAFIPSKPCTTPGCPNARDSDGKCKEHKRKNLYQPGATERGYEEGWADDFLACYIYCAHKIPGKCMVFSELPDHFPKSRKQLIKDGVPEDQLNNWKYLVPSCIACHRHMTAKLQPGGVNRPGWTHGT